MTFAADRDCVRCDEASRSRAQLLHHEGRRVTAVPGSSAPVERLSRCRPGDRPLDEPAAGARPSVQLDSTPVILNRGALVDML
jgi:hypothetical protein